MKILFTIGIIFLIYKVSNTTFRLPKSTKKNKHEDDYIEYEEVDE